jgi:hypothetical protein
MNLLFVAGFICLVVGLVKTVGWMITSIILFILALLSELC